MAEVILNLARNPVNHEIVAELESMLARAKAGEVVGLVLTADLTGHRFMTWGDYRDGPVMLGHLARQMHLVNTSLDAAKDANA